MDPTGGVELVDHGASRAQIGPLDVESSQAGIVPAGSRPAAHSLTELVLGDPLHELGGRARSVAAPLLQGVEGLSPQGQGALRLGVTGTSDSRGDGVKEGALDHQGGCGPAPGVQLVGESGVMGYGPVLLDGVAGEHQALQLAQGVSERTGVLGVGLLQEPQEQVGGSDLEIDGDVEAVGVAVDDVQTTPARTVGVRFVAGVDDRAVEGGLQADLGLDVVGSLTDLETGPLTALADADPAGAHDDGAGDQEGDQDRGQLFEGQVSLHEVVLVRAVGRPLAVDIVLVQDDLRRCARATVTIAQTLHGVSGHHFPGPVPDEGVVGGEDLR